jgi:uncharacterized protein (TIGR03437 family)
MVITTSSPLNTGTVNTAYSQPIAITGGTAPYTWSIVDQANAPPGVLIAANGVLGGVPKATGNYTFTIQATDKNLYTATKQFQLSIAPAGALLTATAKALIFTGSVGGDAPPIQTIGVTAPSGVTVAFGVTVDGGGTTAAGIVPAWISVTPTGGPVPGFLTVGVNQANLQPGKYTAGIHVFVPGNASQVAIDITVTFNVSAGSPQLVPLPTSLKFAARSVTAVAQDQLILITNPGGGGTVNFTTSVVGKSAWITAVTPATGKTGPNAPGVARVFVNTQGLKPGFYKDAVRITSVAGTLNMFISDQGPVLGLSSSGLRFQVRQGAGSTQVQTVSVLDLGDSTTTSAWQAELVTGSDWLALSGSNGVSTPLKPSTFNLTPGPGASALGPGGHYAIVRVSDPGAINSPQYLVAVLDVASANSPALPDPSPAGLYFTNGTGPQTVLVYTSSTDPVPFQATAYTSDLSGWLSATPAFGNASTANPGKVSVSVNAANLPLGIYYGSVNIAMNGVMRSVNVTLVVASATGASVKSSAAAACAPTKLAITQTGLVNNFSVPAGWPATLIVQVNDDCGNSVSSASVVATFSNGDAPLPLKGDLTSNLYSATWQPAAVLPVMTISIRATSASLNPVLQQYSGSVNQNSSTPPTLVPNGALHIFFNSATANALNAGLAPGNVAQVYGTGLASGASQTTVPLPGNFAGTLMLIGQQQAPLFYVSDQLLDVQVPIDLTPNREYSILVSSNSGVTLPSTVSITPIQPGVAQFADGTVIAQISGTTTLISATNPAKPGQSLTIYLAGMGGTNPAVASGQPTPLQLVPVSVQPTVTLDGAPVSYQYAGLTPTGIGLYQINFTVPANARAGTLDLVVSQNGIAANTTKLPVSN